MYMMLSLSKGIVSYDKSVRIIEGNFQEKI